MFKESKDTARVGKLDGLGVPAGTAGIALIMIGLVQGETWGYTDWRIWIIFWFGALLLPLAVVRSSTHPSPLLDLSLFKIRSFSVASISVVFFGLAFLAGFFLNSRLLQDLWGWSVLEAGLALSLPALISAFVAVMSGPLSGTRGQREVIFVGALCSGYSFLHLLLFATENANFWGVYVPSAVALGIGVGLSIASFTSGSLRDIEPEFFAIGNATSRTSQQLSYAVGVTVVVLLVNESTSIEDFQFGWIWVISFYFLSSLVMAVAFPGKLFGLREFKLKSRAKTSDS